MISTDRCPLCAAESPKSFWGEVWDAPGKRVMQCSDCESYFIYPMAKQEEQSRFDAEYDGYISERAKLVGRHARESFDSLVDRSIEVRLQDLKRFFEGRPSVLEIGAEKGGFLDRIASSTGTLAAVDSCPQYKDILIEKGYRAYPYVWDLPQDETYDRVCMFSLLEHIHDPQPFVSRLRECLAPSGLMIIEIPSANEPLLSLYNVPAFKSFYFQAMHPYVYSEKALTMLLTRCGMVIEQVIHKQRYGLANHLQWLVAGTPGGNAYFSSLFAGRTESEYIRSLEASGHTDTLYVIAGKT